MLNYNFKSKKYYEKNLLFSSFQTLNILTTINSFHVFKRQKNFVDILDIYENLALGHFYSNLLKTFVFVKAFNIRDTVPNSLLAYVIYSVQSINWKKYYILHSNEIIESLFLALKVKNLNIFVNWVRKYFEKINLKKHRKLFLLLKFLLGRFVWHYNSFLQLKGVRLSLKGKFGKAGSVRKSRKYIKKGQLSYSKKSLAISSRTILIRTYTGVFSIKTELFY